MATTLYCAIADVQNRLSATGVTYRTDDSPPDDYGDVLDEASRMIDTYCLARYSEANLAASNIVTHWCANLAAYLLCERRGNPVPVGIAAKFDRVMDLLGKVLTGVYRIAGVPERKDGVPVLSNVRTRLDPFPRTVVERNRSTGTPEKYKQHSDKLDYLDYSI